jgi:hypothetical protein
MRPTQLIPILDREFLSAAHGHHTPVMMWGPPGVGKSQMVQQVADKHGVKVIDIRLSQMEPSDLRGIPFREGKGVVWAEPSILPHADKDGNEGILLLDEITSAAPSVSAAAYQLILDRRLGDYHVPKGWAIFAAGNRQGDRGVTYAMPAPLANRFSHFDVDANLDDWSQWAYEHAIDDRVIGFLRYRPELLFDFDPSRHQNAFPTPRSWEFAHRALQKFGDQPDLLGPALAACVGQAAGIEFSAYLANLSRMPDLDAIVEGRPAEVPRDTDLQYAVAAALVARAIRNKHGANIKDLLGHILDYAAKLPLKEMGVMLVSDIHRQFDRDGKGQILFGVPQFATWANQVADIVLYE